ncbi:hypothetical protein FV285_23515, partial [Escherichia coli]|uniref:hypothetical protein n=1 Tax=Escherichia coli TaxID=562 RepID=UPI0011C948E1
MSTSNSSGQRRALATRLGQVTIRDENRLRRRRDKARTDDAFAALDRDIARAETVVANRRAAVPTLEFPEALPVSLRKDDIAAAIA